MWFSWWMCCTMKRNRKYILLFVCVSVYVMILITALGFVLSMTTQSSIHKITFVYFMYLNYILYRYAEWMYLSLIEKKKTTDLAILLFLWGGYFLPACLLFSLRITHVIKRWSAYPLTLDLRIWWWSIAYVGCRKCWTASQRKGFQCFKLTGKCLFFGPL